VSAALNDEPDDLDDDGEGERDLDHGKAVCPTEIVYLYVHNHRRV
jgi:hypothetical protein